jgi:hypothetical protein
VLGWESLDVPFVHINKSPLSHKLLGAASAATVFASLGKLAALIPQGTPAPTKTWTGSELRGWGWNDKACNWKPNIQTVTSRSSQEGGMLGDQGPSSNPIQPRLFKIRLANLLNDFLLNQDNMARHIWRRTSQGLTTF